VACTGVSRVKVAIIQGDSQVSERFDYVGEVGRLCHKRKEEYVELFIFSKFADFSLLSL